MKYLLEENEKFLDLMMTLVREELVVQRTSQNPDLENIRDLGKLMHQMQSSLAEIGRSEQKKVRYNSSRASREIMAGDLASYQTVASGNLKVKVIGSEPRGSQNGSGIVEARVTSDFTPGYTRGTIVYLSSTWMFFRSEGNEVKPKESK
jgi:hypothetical protein